MRVSGVIAVGVLVALAVTGCGTGGRDDGPTRTATLFAKALDTGDLAAACALLAPTTREELEQSASAPCEDALEEENLSPLGQVDAVSVYGLTAQVRGSEDTLFLDDLGGQGRWRVAAAGCQARSGEPYECTVKGA